MSKKIEISGAELITGCEHLMKMVTHELTQNYNLQQETIQCCCLILV